MNSEWYLAELVMRISVEDDPRSVVHQNLVLIRGGSPNEAYEKALQNGKNSECSYENAGGKMVQISFEGLSDLDLIHEELEDGAEIAFRYSVDLSEEQIRSMVRGRDQLRVFLPPKKADGPNYASAEILALAERELRRGGQSGGEGGGEGGQPE